MTNRVIKIKFNHMGRLIPQKLYLKMRVLSSGEFAFKVVRSVIDLSAFLSTKSGWTFKTRFVRTKISPCRLASIYKKKVRVKPRRLTKISPNKIIV